MRSSRKMLVLATLSAVLLAGCGNSGGPDATGALESKAAPPEVPGKVKVKVGSRRMARPKTVGGQEYATP